LHLASIITAASMPLHRSPRAHCPIHIHNHTHNRAATQLRRNAMNENLSAPQHDRSTNPPGVLHITLPLSCRSSIGSSHPGLAASGRIGTHTHHRRRRPCRTGSWAPGCSRCAHAACGPAVTWSVVQPSIARSGGRGGGRVQHPTLQSQSCYTILVCVFLFP
jgi:hypothetical protein